VVFQKPDAASITVATYPRSQEGGEGEEFSNPFLDEGFAASIGIDAAPAFYETALPPAVVANPTRPASGPSRHIPRQALPPTSPIAQEEEARDPKVLMALVAAGLVLIYLGLLGGSGPLRRLPGPIGRVLPEPEADGPVDRGIGRFARPRDHPPLKL
jgi:hypothetical protein